MSDVRGAPSKKQQELERVGVLVVHGIGQQRTYEHLVATARNIAQSLKDDNSHGSLDVQISISTSPDAAFRADQKIWSSRTSAPVIITVKNQIGFITQIELHEVWWADLGEPTTLGTLLQFWYWGLSLWAIQGYFKNTLHDEKTQNCKRYPQTGKEQITCLERLILFGVSLIAWLILPLLATISRGLSIFDIRILPLDVLSQYLSRVRIFQQSVRNAPGTLEDFDQPPRVPIRRRMIESLVKMALAKYNRWYILAHSQGTVLAFNGLMELEQMLPNYLPKDLWKKAQKALGKKAPEGEEARGVMYPKRPHWLEDNDLICRKKLFKNLHGFLTYGSPLKKFARLWPAIVYLNKDEKVFDHRFEWINIYDPTDPIAGPVMKIFDPLPLEDPVPPTKHPTEDYRAPNPSDIAYRSPSIHLISHTTYLSSNKRGNQLLAKKVSRWLLYGHCFEKECFPKIGGFKNSLWVLTRIIIWLVIGFFSAAISNFLFYHFLVFTGLKTWIDWISNQLHLNFKYYVPGILYYFPSGIQITVVLAVFMVILAGIVKFIEQRLVSPRNSYKAGSDLENFFQQNRNNKFKRDKIYEKFSFYSKKTIEQALNKLEEEKVLEKLEEDLFTFPHVRIVMTSEESDCLKKESKGSRDRMLLICDFTREITSSINEHVKVQEEIEQTQEGIKSIDIRSSKIRHIFCIARKKPRDVDPENQNAQSPLWIAELNPLKDSDKTLIVCYKVDADKSKVDYTVTILESKWE